MNCIVKATFQLHSATTGRRRVEYWVGKKGHNARVGDLESYFHEVREAFLFSFGDCET